MYLTPKIKKMKKIVLALATVLLISAQINAQDKKSSSLRKGEMKVVIVEDENGSKTTFDSTFSIEDRQKVEELLKQKGIDFKMEFNGDELEVLEKGNHKFMIKEEIEGEAGENGVHKVVKVRSGSDNINEEEIEVIIESLGDEIEELKKQIHINIHDGNKFEFKTESMLSEEELKKLKEEMSHGEKQVIMKTIVLEENDNGEVETKVFEFKTDAMVFFISEEIRDDMDDDLPTELIEKDLQSLQLKELKLFPNPNNGHFNISFDSNQKNDFQISVADVNGRVVYEKELTNFKGKFNEDFDLSQQESGLYFFNIVSGKHRETKKIILK